MNMTKNIPQKSNASKQRGIILPITLISLMILLIASVALIRSTDTSLLVAGHISFKRDILNQAERAIPKIKNQFVATTGDLYESGKREGNLTNSNYYASIQASNDSGIPNVLLNTTTFDGQFASNNIVDSTAGITIRYLIDRMCIKAGIVSVANCSTVSSTTDVGGDAMHIGNGGKASGVDVPIYRISIRVSGPRNTEAFIQSTFSI
jgi:type IV pilus assembly protein PilX